MSNANSREIPKFMVGPPGIGENHNSGIVLCYIPGYMAMREINENKVDPDVLAYLLAHRVAEREICYYNIKAYDGNRPF